MITTALLFINQDSALAERFAFFCKNCAKTVFDNGSLKTVKNQGFKFFPDRKKDKEEEEVQSQKEETNKISETPAEKKVAENTSKADDIISKYGDPSKDFPVLAKSDAPKPFQGMMAALEKGDEKLAFQYARQYVRYLHRLNSRSLQVTGIVGKALQSEGLSTGDDWTSSPEYDRYNYLLQQSIKDERAIIRNNDDTAEHVLKAAKVFLKKQKEITAKTKAAAAEKIRNEQLENDQAKRERIRAELLRARVPVDPAGKVDVMLFIKPKDINSIKAASALQKAYSLSKKKFNVILLTPMQESNSDLLYFRAKSRARFVIKNGEGLARALKLNSYPHLIATARTTGKSFVVAGAKDSDYYVELINLMQGGK
ncbi:MAG: hypothetical protein D6780_04345 [Candidatus Dadabacteria bacterium]|nr:MAG: hypothetical protein D6780_04345 [Candidatus Dadabacteria bacterium]